MSKGKPSSLTAYRITFTHDGHAHLEEVDGPAKRDSFYYVRDETITDTFWSTLPEELADLIDVALAVYVADRLARRHSQAADRHQRNWSRHFHLRLPLRDPERWHDQALNAQLRAVLAFLTDDKWCFDFFPRSGSRRISEMRRYLYPTLPASPVTAALFSGGVDSSPGSAASWSNILPTVRSSFAAALTDAPLVCSANWQKQHVYA